MKESFPATIIEIGNSKGITIPSRYCEHNKLEAGQKIRVTISDEVQE